MNVDLAVIGAGPAGMAAARQAGRAGLSIVVIEEGTAAGGRFFGPLTGHNAQRPQVKPGLTLLNGALQAGARLLVGTSVWNANRIGDGFLLSIEGPSGESRIESRTVVVAAGAYDRPHLFPGWTLPGVMTAGGLQQLVKRTGVTPGGRVVLAGTGPFLLPVAGALLEHGLKPAAVFESASRRDWARFSFASVRMRSHLREGAGYGATLARAGVVPRFGWQVAGAEGRDRIETVILRRSDGKPGEKRIQCDTLALAYGFLGQIEVPSLLGVELRFDATQRQWLPSTNDDTSTGVPGLFVCGDGARVRGYDAATKAGSLAGALAARHLGRGPSTVAFEAAAHRAAEFGRLVATTFPAPDSLRWATADTIVCRCEDVTLGEVEAAAKAGADSVTALKAWCRAGQGPCQSRTCGTILAAAVSQARGVPLAEAGRASVRPPIRPVLLQHVAESTVPGSPEHSREG